MWEAVDTLVAEAATLGDPMQRTIARKVTEFVNLIRSLAETRKDKGLYDFGLELASRTGILALYRQENTPESASAIDNIEELLNSMQLFREQREAEIRNGERTEDEQPTVEEWLQSIMLLTDMDNDSEEEGEKVTLMTVHSSKGLEYKYVYIVGCEENLFPSQRALESPDGLEEERRLFYVALTRAKQEAMLSYCEMRFKWGNMEFSSPSRFLKEIDEQYLDCDEDLNSSSRNRFASVDEDELSSRADFTGRMGNFKSTTNYGGGGRAYATQNRGAGADGGSAIEALRRRFDVRFQQKREQEARAGGIGGRTAAPDPKLIRSVEPRSTEGMRRVPVTPRNDAVAAGPCAYSVGDRVEHPKFGVGIINRIENMATDHKVVVDFGGQYGEKTLLAKFAKLTKL